MPANDRGQGAGTWLQTKSIPSRLPVCLAGSSRPAARRVC